MKWVSCCGARSRQCSLIKPDGEGVIPLSAWADLELAALFQSMSAFKPAELSARTLLGERAFTNGYKIPGHVSAGGGCRLYQAKDGYAALSLVRPTDHDTLAALFQGEHGDLEKCFARCSAAEIVAHGRTLGLAIASLFDEHSSKAINVTMQGSNSPLQDHPLVIDLSALWAGPLASHIMMHAGAGVIKVESRNRPDAMRHGDPKHFARLNGQKGSVAVDLRENADRNHLIALIRKADIVIEASRPRALLQLDIDADALVREVPGLVWVTITGHGVEGDAANWIGFGDDCGVAGGLSAALFNATGQLGFVGDAIADPLTGIFAAHHALVRRHSGLGGRLNISMSGVVSQAIKDETSNDRNGFIHSLKQWASNMGQAFQAVPDRQSWQVTALGNDNAQYGISS